MFDDWSQLTNAYRVMWLIAYGLTLASLEFGLVSLLEWLRRRWLSNITADRLFLLLSGLCFALALSLAWVALVRPI